MGGEQALLATTFKGPLQGESNRQRAFYIPKIDNFDCSSRPLTPGRTDSNEELGAFSSLPLLPIGLSKYMEVTHCEGKAKEGVRRKLRVDVSSHPYADSHVGKSILQRLEKDVAAYAEMESTASHASMRGLGAQQIQELVSHPGGGAGESAVSSLRELEKTLRDLRGRDRSDVERTIREAKDLVNGVGSLAGQEEPVRRRKKQFVLAQTARVESSIEYDYLVNSLLSTSSDADLEKLNPFLDKETIDKAYDKTICSILHACRIAQIHHALDLLNDLIRFLQRLRSVRLPKQRASKSLFIMQEKLAQALIMKRHHMNAHVQNGSSVSLYFDPRYLVFEFSQDILIRKAQVELIDRFVGRVAHGHSMVSQMIMGAGKTTVVGPLLSLLLANGHQLVTQAQCSPSSFEPYLECGGGGGGVYSFLLDDTHCTTGRTGPAAGVLA